MLNKPLAFSLNAAQHVRRIDDIERGPGNGAGQRIAAVGGTVRPNVERGRNLLRGQHSADREAAAQRFRTGKNIRRHAVVHIGEQIAGAPHTALNFIKHQQRLMPIAQLAQALQKRWRCGGDAAFSLDRLHHHRAGMVIHHRFHRVQVVERNMDDIRRFRAKSVGILRLTTNGNGKQRAAMKGVMEGDDFGFKRAMTHAGIVARQFEGGFVGFGAGVHKQHALGEGRVDKLTPQTQRRFVSKNVAGVPQRFTLRFQRVHQRRMAMP